ncbi:Riboflavin kinase [Penicillium chermesinum]|nr:Riboflavin kinase [Penicillium chermesinum]
MRPDKPRDAVAGPDAGPEAPYPKDLGIPTANIPADNLSVEHPDLTTGVYYGVVALDPKKFVPDGAEATAQTTLFPAVLSIGYNPFYKNEVRSVPSPTAVPQPKFHRLPDFYGTELHLLILGYIRPEFDYVSMEALIEDIRVDCEVARQSLLREAYQRYLVDDGKASEEVNAARNWLVSFP